jgi:Zn finger protein HypA/HybF involved in hydrogenase expression
MRLKKVIVKEPAHFQCVKCKHEWKQQPGFATCPVDKCRHMYVTWLNFETCLEYVYEELKE